METEIPEEAKYLYWALFPHWDKEFNPEFRYISLCMEGARYAGSGFDPQARDRTTIAYIEHELWVAKAEKYILPKLYATYDFRKAEYVKVQCYNKLQRLEAKLKGYPIYPYH